MAAKYRETEYVYSSARVRSLEGSIVGRERLEHMTEAKSTAEIIAMLPEYGFELVFREGSDGRDMSEIMREDTLLSVLKKSYSDIDGMINSAHVLDFMRYQYDCNNIKAVIKCNARGVDAASMLIDLGTVRADMIPELIAKKDYSPFPENMAKAAEEAIEAFNKTLDPQQVDLIMDRACFADMYDSARKSGVDYIVRLVRTKIDLVNIITCIRVIRMKFGARGADFLREALLDGGTIEKTFFAEGYEGGEQRLFELLGRTEYAKFADRTGAGEKLSVIERVADDTWMEVARTAKYVPFGIPVLVGYMAALEYEVKNIRIVMAGKDAGLAPDVIRERLRASYV